jgi:hypothetical protein
MNTIQQTIDIAQVKHDLAEAFPNYLVRNAALNKKMVQVVNGPIMALVQLKNGKVNMTMTINFLTPWIFIVFVLLMALTLVGGLVFYWILWTKKKPEMRAMELELQEFFTKKNI